MHKNHEVSAWLCIKNLGQILGLNYLEQIVKQNLLHVFGLYKRFKGCYNLNWDLFWGVGILWKCIYGKDGV